jgi:putative flippase GtrA
MSAPRATGRHGRFIIYLLIGGVNTLVGYGSFAALNWTLTGRLPYAYMFANAFANVIAISVAFIGYKAFVFRTRGNWWAEYLRCWVVYGATALLGLALLPVLVALARLILSDGAWAPYVAQAVLIPVAVLTSYAGHGRFSFASKAPESSLDPRGRTE